MTTSGNAFQGAPRAKGVALMAGALIASPLLYWLVLSALSHFTFLEPPFTGSRGLVLAMQLFFAPANIIAVIVGVGLMRRSERMRRAARVLFLIALGLSLLQIGLQVNAQRFDSHTPLAIAMTAVSALYWWYFGRQRVRQQFHRMASKRQAKPSPMSMARAEPGTVTYPRALIVAACVECLLGLAAALLLSSLYTVLFGRPLLDLGGGDEVAAADDVLKAFLFVAFALLLSPHALSTAASIGILLGRHTASMARRYAVLACWSVIGALLLTAWVTTKSEFAFDARSARLLLWFCGVSIVWHACFLTIAARCGSPAGAR